MVKLVTIDEHLLTTHQRGSYHNDMRDPHYGWYGYILVPLFIGGAAVQAITNVVTIHKDRQKLKKILKDNPDIDELHKLAGLDKKK